MFSYIYFGFLYFKVHVLIQLPDFCSVLWSQLFFTQIFLSPVKNQTLVLCVTSWKSQEKWGEMMFETIDSGLNPSLKFGYAICNEPSWLMKATRDFLHCKQLFSTAKSRAKPHLFQQLHFLNILPVLISEAWATQTELICSLPLALADYNLVRYNVVIHVSECSPIGLVEIHL